MEDYGEWQRPAAYLGRGETRSEAIKREARNVRTAAGLFDGTPLGKIEIQGPDALAFADRFYINNLVTLRPGRARYGLMLRESGVIFDDGTVVLLAPDHVLITTTLRQCKPRGGVARGMASMRVAPDAGRHHFGNGTVGNTVVGGKSCPRDPRKARYEHRLVSRGLPHLAMRQGTLLGHSARVYRVSFTGELTFEINVPAEAARIVWEALLRAGEPLGLQPLGIEATAGAAVGKKDSSTSEPTRTEHRCRMTWDG